jgi:hypothetical protein
LDLAPVRIRQNDAGQRGAERVGHFIQCTRVLSKHFHHKMLYPE